MINEFPYTDDHQLNLDWIVDYVKNLQLTPGPAGANGISPTIAITNITGGHRVTITDENGTHSFDVLDGTPGFDTDIAVTNIAGGHRLTITDSDGTTTFDVLDGISPTLAVTNITGGHRITITDANGTAYFDVMDGNNGTNGTNGVSPSITVTNILGGHRVTITDANGTNAFDVMDGASPTDYETLSNLPAINGVTLIGDQSGWDLGLNDLEWVSYGSSTNSDIDDILNNGKIPILAYNNVLFIFNQYITANLQYFSAVVQDTVNIIECRNDSWSIDTLTIPKQGTSNPQPLGTAAPGTSLYYSAANHVHPMPTPHDVGAVAENAVADQFDATANYLAGDYVYYNGNIYQFNVNHSAGAWTGTDADQITLTDDFQDLWNAIEEITTISEQIIFTSGYYIKTGNINIGSTVNMTPTSSTSWSYAVVPCVPGDTFTVNVEGASSARAWAFVDATNKLLSNAAAGVVNTTITAPSNAAKAIFNDKSANGSVYKISGNSVLTNIKKVKYVKTTGNDLNNGDSPNTAYATIYKALSEGASEIYIEKGTYTETQQTIETNYRYKSIKIVGNNAIVNCDQGFHFRYCDVDISGLTITPTGNNGNEYGIFTLNCTGKITDCIVNNSAYMGFRLDGSKLILERCIANTCAVDGFNGHTVNTGYDTECSLINCIAHDCGDDGASIHESGKMYIIGGEYYNNTQTGIAPYNLCSLECINVYVHNNGHSGIECIQPNYTSGNPKGWARIMNCISTGNTKYGVYAEAYDVVALNNSLSGNTLGTYEQGSNASITVFLPSTT